MADDEVARRREIRMRKILEGSEARLKKITSSYSSKVSDENTEKNANVSDTEENAKYASSKSYDCKTYNFVSDIRNKACEAGSSSIRQNYTKADKVFNDFSGKLSGGDSFESNGNYERMSNTENYTFPKKVSDAEARSYGRTRSDIRRRSSCTQIMIENFNLYTFSLSVLRPWLTFFVALVLRIYVLWAGNMPTFQTIYLPLLLLELAFLAWFHLESQMFSKPAEGYMISSILMLCGLSEVIVQRFISTWTFIHLIIEDFIIYTFCFVFSHFVCETCL